MDRQHELRRIGAELLGMKVLLAALRLRLAVRFNPDQPRDETGRWIAGGGAESDAEGNDVAPAAATPESVFERCEEQQKRDIFHCNMVGLAQCYAQAAVRYAACLRGDRIPPLNY